MEQINEETSDFKEKMQFLTDNYVNNLVSGMEKLEDLEKITNKNIQLENTIETQKKEIDDLHMLIQQKDEEIESITEEKNNLSKVSQVKMLHVTLDQQNREIESLKKQELLKRKQKRLILVLTLVLPNNLNQNQLQKKNRMNPLVKVKLPMLKRR